MIDNYNPEDFERLKHGKWKPWWEDPSRHLKKFEFLSRQIEGYTNEPVL